jgi:hypothetical protein
MCGGCENCIMADKNLTSYENTYQIHLSISKDKFVDGRFMSVVTEKDFIELCDKINVKPLIVKNFTKKESIYDMFTNKIIYGSLDDAFREVKTLNNYFSANGIRVIREKIETHPLNSIITGTGYYERHWKLLNSDYDSVKTLMYYTKWCDCFGVSENMVTKQCMLTYRSKAENINKFEYKISNILNSDSFILPMLSNFITEYTIYDSKIDKEWIPV